MVYARASSATLTSDHLERFVTTLAANDKKAKRSWVPDEQIVSAIRGYTRCFTAATGTRAEIPYDAIAELLATYRRRRGMLAPVDEQAQTVLFVAA
jgi:hypothetical protein